jgi:hypothetical protein
MNYPSLTKGASSPSDESFLLFPGNLLYISLKNGMKSRGFLFANSGLSQPRSNYIKLSIAVTVSNLYTYRAHEKMNDRSELYLCVLT